MFTNNGTSNENRRKAHEISAEDVEAINVRRPIRLNAYANIYATYTTEPSASSVNALGNFGLAAEKSYENDRTQKPLDPQAMQEAMRNLGIVGSSVEA